MTPSTIIMKPVSAAVPLVEGFWQLQNGRLVAMWRTNEQQEDRAPAGHARAAASQQGDAKI